jgi:hypothetical protein
VKRANDFQGRLNSPNVHTYSMHISTATSEKTSTDKLQPVRTRSDDQKMQQEDDFGRE